MFVLLVFGSRLSESDAVCCLSSVGFRFSNTQTHTASERGWVVVRHDRQEESEASPFAATPFPYTKST